MNGKSVEIDNTDAEGRLVLSGDTLFVSVCLLGQLKSDRRSILHFNNIQATHAYRRGHTYGV